MTEVAHIEGCPGRNVLHRDVEKDHNGAPCACPCHDGQPSPARPPAEHLGDYHRAHARAASASDRSGE